MESRSTILADLNNEQRRALESRLLHRQSGRCFICNKVLDLILDAGKLDVDHIDPLVNEGRDEENNFALTHASCNRSKGASDLRVARRMAEFDELQETARESGARGANLGHVLSRYGGAKSSLKLKVSANVVEFKLADETIQQTPLYRDGLSGMDYFFAVMPLDYLHHDDRINPRGIGTNIRGLIEEFMKKRPQLHVSLAWWAPDEGENSGQIKVFDGQHKAAAQILLGVTKLPHKRSPGCKYQCRR
jgi:5-methylcytosine-specific restriction endonuclease McrA